MSGKYKIRQKADVALFPNVLEYTYFNEENRPKGKWNDDIFKNSNSITLELACGKGEYTVNLARKFPQRNFIGIDIKGPRIWRGAKTALEEELDNVRFLRMFIDHLDDYFGNNEVQELWIIFPDPYSGKYSKWTKRLTSPKFLDIYRKILKPNGIIHLKTDSEILYSYTLETIKQEKCGIIRQIDNVYSQAPDDDILAIETHYEKIHRRAGKIIRYVAFRL